MDTHLIASQAQIVTPHTRAQPSPPASTSGVRAAAGGPRRPWPWQRHLKLAFRLSWAANWLLLGLKIAAFVVSRSKAVLASLADSGVDLASQLVLSVAESQKGKYHPKYPVGRTRLEAIGVIACACIMSVASLEVIQFAGFDLYNGFAKGEIPELDLSPLTFVILGGGTLLKVALYVYCNALRGRSDSIKALAEDHINDVASNGGAIAATIVVKFWPAGWWVDPVAAIVISIIIGARWASITYEQVQKIVGAAAPDEFRERVERLAAEHHPELTVDCSRAYHFGPRYMVELEVVLPASMTVNQAHDISLDLQHKVEALEEVERAFVHVDYEQRHLPEHKVERVLLLHRAERDAMRRSSSAVTALP